MTYIFRSLQTRYFDKGVYLAKELEDCQEILLVEKGYYKVGFQVNNTEYMPIMFGPSTRIGSYNVLYMVRYEFAFKTVTPMYCFSISIQSMNDIFDEVPQFKIPMRR